MITKERLEELIKEEKYVFSTWGGEIKYFKPDEDYLTIRQRYLEQMFENEEDAKEYLKYGNVKKTVELVMADWNDVKNTTHGYCGSFWEENILYELIIEGGEVYIRMTDYYYSEFENQFNRENYEFKKEFNKENYNEARDLFVKLFMGEEE